MSRFFVQEIGGAAGGTGNDVLETIKRLIAGEDPARPLSDRVIAEALSLWGLQVSRRTVAKYREDAAIPAAAARRIR